MCGTRAAGTPLALVAHVVKHDDHVAHGPSRPATDRPVGNEADDRLCLLISQCAVGEYKVVMKKCAAAKGPTRKGSREQAEGEVEGVV